MKEDDKIILRACVSLVLMPFWLLFTFYVHVPFLIARRIWRWQRLPQHQRNAINANERIAREHGWAELEEIIKAELLMHGLPDTPANRSMLNSAKVRRRR